MPRHALRSTLELTRTLVEAHPFDTAAAATLVDRIGSLAGPHVERPARKAALALEFAQAKPKTRYGVIACYAVMDLIIAAERALKPRLH